MTAYLQKHLKEIRCRLYVVQWCTRHWHVGNHWYVNYTSQQIDEMLTCVPSWHFGLMFAKMWRLMLLLFASWCHPQKGSAFSKQQVFTNPHTSFMKLTKVQWWQTTYWQKIPKQTKKASGICDFKKYPTRDLGIPAKRRMTRVKSRFWHYQCAWKTVKSLCLTKQIRICQRKC